MADTHNDNNVNNKAKSITKKINSGLRLLKEQQGAFKRIMMDNDGLDTTKCIFIIFSDKENI